MKVFFDTSVLVAASVRSHPHHSQALPALQKAIAASDRGFMSSHSLAEVYAVLTRLPVLPRIHPAEAARILTDNLLSHLETVPVEKRDYIAALTVMQEGGWSGAKIYDVILLRCAAKAHVERLYTFNLTDFRVLAPPSLHDKICTP